MEEKKTDRRVKYTKALLRDALVASLQDTHISKISVKALCDRADVNRSTFYAHYADQYDLLREIEQEVQQNLLRYLRKETDDRIPIDEQNLTRVLEYASSNAELFKVLLSENCDMDFQKNLIELAHVLPYQYEGVSRRMQDYLISFGLNSCVTVLQKWLQDGMIESPREMAQFILKILFYGISAIQPDGQNMPKRPNERI